MCLTYFLKDVLGREIGYWQRESLLRADILLTRYAIRLAFIEDVDRQLSMTGILSILTVIIYRCFSNTTAHKSGYRGGAVHTKCSGRIVIA